MNNNAVYKKMTIANNLKQFEVKEVFALGGLELSSSAIKALSAGPQNKNFIKMTDNQLEAFFNGLILYWRGAKDENDMVPRGIENYIMNLMKDGNADVLEELGCLIDDAKGGIALEATASEMEEPDGQGSEVPYTKEGADKA